jgi:hypothetical protein
MEPCEEPVLWGNPNMLSSSNTAGMKNHFPLSSLLQNVLPSQPLFINAKDLRSSSPPLVTETHHSPQLAQQAQQMLEVQHSPAPPHTAPPAPWNILRNDTLSVLSGFLSVHKMEKHSTSLATFLGLLHTLQSTGDTFSKSPMMMLGNYTDPVMAVTALLSCCVKIHCYKPVRGEEHVFVASNHFAEESGKMSYNSNGPHGAECMYMLPSEAGVFLDDACEGIVYTQDSERFAVTVTCWNESDGTKRVRLAGSNRLGHVRNENYKVIIHARNTSSSAPTKNNIVICGIVNFHRAREVDLWQKICRNIHHTLLEKQKGAVDSTCALMTPLNTFINEVKKVMKFDEASFQARPVVKQHEVIYPNVQQQQQPPQQQPPQQQVSVEYHRPPYSPVQLRQFFERFPTPINDSEAGTYAPTLVDEFDYAIQAVNDGIKNYCNYSVNLQSWMSNEFSHDDQSQQWADLCAYLEQSSKYATYLLADDVCSAGIKPHQQSMYKALGFKSFSRKGMKKPDDFVSYANFMDNEPLPISFDDERYVITDPSMLISVTSVHPQLGDARLNSTMNLSSPQPHANTQATAAWHEPLDSDIEMQSEQVLSEYHASQQVPAAAQPKEEECDYEFSEPIAFCFQWRNDTMPSHCFLVVYDWKNSTITVVATDMKTNATDTSELCSFPTTDVFYDDYDGATKRILWLLQQAHNQYSSAGNRTLRLSVIPTPAQQAYVRRVVS